MLLLSAEAASLLTVHRKKGIGAITKSDTVALLIGIFVQIIWEDKPITQPL